MMYDNYWGSVERINELIFIAVVLDPYYKLEYISIFDPCYKLQYISICFLNIYDDAIVKVMTDDIKNDLIHLYDYYKFYDNA